MAISEEDLQAAEHRLSQQRASGYASSAHFDPQSTRIVIEMDTGVQLAIPAEKIEGLSGSSVEQLAEIEISEAGLGLYWPRLDVDVYVPALLQGIFGSRRWMAVQLGAKGGSARSEAKKASARENGRKGGRPSKAAIS